MAFLKVAFKLLNMKKDFVMNILPLFIIAMFVFVLPQAKAQQASRKTSQAQISMLGFSHDARYFVLAETIERFPHAPAGSLRIWDVASNQCVPTACIDLRESKHSIFTGANLMKKMLVRSWKTRQDFGLAPPHPGDLVAPRQGEDNRVEYPLEPTPIMAALRQVPRENGEATAMMLHLRQGEFTTQVGDLTKFQPGVVEFRLDNLYLARDGKSVVILVATFYRLTGSGGERFRRYQPISFRLPAPATVIQQPVNFFD